MGGLVEQAGGPGASAAEDLARARNAWAASMLAALDRLRPALQACPPGRLAELSGGTWGNGQIRLTYWGRPVTISFPALQATAADGDQIPSTFDLAMLLFYLNTADGSPPTGKWISFRELPEGLFYHQAFQGYSGDRLAHAYGANPAQFAGAAEALGGTPLPDLASLAYSFDPLPAVRMAAILWPGDDEFAARASILFDAAASHFMPTDGLALLGAGLTGRLLKAGSSVQAEAQ